MSRASFKTFVAAAGGAGGVSYWIDEIVPDNNNHMATRLAFNNDRETMMLIAVDQVDGSKRYVEIDYDGAIQREGKTNSMSGSYSYQSINIQRGMNDQYLTIYTAGVYQTDPRLLSNGLTGTIQTQDLSLANNTTPGLAYYNTGYMNPRGALYSDDDYALVVHGGYVATYFTGYGTYFAAQVNVKKFTYSSTGAVPTPLSYYNWDTGYASYSDTRWVAISPASSTGYHLMTSYVYDFAGGPNSVAYFLYRGTTGTGTNAARTASGEGSGYQGSIGIHFDSSDNFVSVQNFTYTARVWKNTAGSVPTYYWPNIRYSVSLNSISSTNAQPIDSALDSDDNLYILYSTGHIGKWNSAMNLQWCVKVENTSAAPYQTSTLYYGSLDIPVIDGTDVICITLTQAARSGQTTKNLAVYKLPIDLDNYTGTYGDYSITTVSNAFTVATQATFFGQQAVGGSNTMSVSNFLSPSTTTNTTLSVTNTPV